MILWLVSLAAAADLTGTWRMDLHLVHDVKVPILGSSRTDSYTVQLWQIRDGRMTNEHCSIRAVTRMPIGKPTIPDAFVRNIRHGAAAVQSTGTGFEVDLGVSTIGYLEGDLPTGPEDPNVVDHEGDGHPGATMLVWAPIFGQVPLYIAQRTHLLLDGEIEGDTIRGKARQTELMQRTLSAGNRLFIKQASLEPVPEESGFEMTRVPEGTSCSEMLDRTPVPP